MTDAEFQNFIGMIQGAYPGQFITTGPTMDIWWDELADIPFDEAYMALKLHIRRSTFPPSIHDVLKYCTSADLEIKVPQEVAQSIYKLVQRYGYSRYDDALLQMDELTKRVVRAVGWRKICLEEWTWTEKQFIRVYEEIAGNNPILAISSHNALMLGGDDV